MAPRSKLILSSGVLAVGLAASAGPAGPFPPLGPFLDPLRGVWRVADSAQLPPSATAVIPDLDASVRVVYDDRSVPHIFASSVSDARRALGYVVARDRLFQMELQTRATAGTLTELLGETLLGADVRARRLSLARAAEQDFARLRDDPEVSRALYDYAEGVNTFVDALSPAERPFEYHLLGASPQRWEPVHSLYGLKRMGLTLTFNPTEVRKARVAALVGTEAADALFPVNRPIQEPVVPHRGARFVGTELPPPRDPDPAALGRMEAPFQERRAMDPLSEWSGPTSSVGSNNWAVAAERSASGNAILAGDPHLSLGLPSIWYEAHLVVPGVLDVYGVTLAGMPGIVIGFNRNVAWTFTNTAADVMDYYRERLDDPEAPERYLLDGGWTDLDTRVEEFRGRNGDLLATDTVRHSHRGPVLDVLGEPMSLRWTVLDGQNEVRALMGAQRALSVDRWLDAMSGWHAPVQNALVAGRDGRIAIQSAGYYPLRPRGARGDAFQDGTTGKTDWLGRWEGYPRSVDPAQGYLASANQQPFDPEAEDTYIGADWSQPWRALTINELLEGREDHRPEDLESYQTHPSSVRARTFRAAFLEAASRLRDGSRSYPEVDTAARLLAAWDGTYTPENEGAVLFEGTMAALEDALWDELEDEDGRRVATPGADIAWALLAQPGSPWWDDRDTPEVEDRDMLLGRALTAGLANAREAHGPEEGGGWAWGQVAHYNIYHLLGLPALSRLGLAATGGPGLLSPLVGRGTHGASWRMVVELGDEVTARGGFPGGQSGNPVSERYDDRLDRWLQGELDDLRFPRTEEDLRAGGWVQAELVLVGTER